MKPSIFSFIINFINISRKLDGGLELVLFFHMLGIIIPTDYTIFFRGVGIPPTSNIILNYILSGKHTKNYGNHHFS